MQIFLNPVLKMWKKIVSRTVLNPVTPCVKSALSPIIITTFQEDKALR